MNIGPKQSRNLDRFLFQVKRDLNAESFSQQNTHTEQIKKQTTFKDLKATNMDSWTEKKARGKRHLRID